jgi:membrane associated rhomboid family serine protease
VQHTIQQEIKGVIAFVGAMWVVFVLEFLLPFDLTSFGLTPRTLTGLVGIPAMPFLHANLQHIVSNTVPIFILLILLAGSKANSWEVVIEIVLLGGVLLWLFGRPANHIGASGLISGLIAFLIVSGLLERRFVPLVISVVVIFFYGGSLLLGVVPRLGSHISWDGHLFGAVAGGIIAYLLTSNSKAAARAIKSAKDEG